MNKLNQPDFEEEQELSTFRFEVYEPALATFEEEDDSDMLGSLQRI